MGQRLRSNILTISLWLFTRTPLSYFDRGCLFLAQLLLIVCRFQRKLQIITAMTLESMLIRICLTRVCFLIKVLQILYNNCQYDILVKSKGHNNSNLVGWLVKQMYPICFDVGGINFAY